MDRDDDGTPLIQPVSSGRDGPEPLIIELPGQAARIAELLEGAHADGFAWGDMAVLCRDATARDLCARVPTRRKLPVENRLGTGDYHPRADTVKVMTMMVSKGLEFPLVAIHRAPGGPGSRRSTGPCPGAGTVCGGHPGNAAPGAGRVRVARAAPPQVKGEGGLPSECSR